MPDFTLYDVGLMKYEMEEIIGALDLSAHICMCHESNNARYHKVKAISNRFKTLLSELENEDAKV
jgi:hypothetical protein